MTRKNRHPENLELRIDEYNQLVELVTKVKQLPVRMRVPSEEEIQHVYKNALDNEWREYYDKLQSKLVPLLDNVKRYSVLVRRKRRDDLLEAIYKIEASFPNIIRLGSHTRETLSKASYEELKGVIEGLKISVPRMYKSPESILDGVIELRTGRDAGGKLNYEVREVMTVSTNDTYNRRLHEFRGLDSLLSSTFFEFL